MKVWKNKTNTFGKLLGLDNRNAFEGSYVRLGIKGEAIVLEVLPRVIMEQEMITRGKSLTKKNVKDQAIENVASSVGLTMTTDGKFTIGTLAAHLCAIYDLKEDAFDGLGQEFSLKETTVNEQFRTGEPSTKTEKGGIRYPKATYTLKAFELSLKGASTVEDDDIAGTVKA